MLMNAKISKSIATHFFFFFFNDTATTDIYTLSLHDALPISSWRLAILFSISSFSRHGAKRSYPTERPRLTRSEEHTSELQSQSNLVCRLLLEKKKKKSKSNTSIYDQKQAQ